MSNIGDRLQEVPYESLDLARPYGNCRDLPHVLKPGFKSSAHLKSQNMVLPTQKFPSLVLSKDACDDVTTPFLSNFCSIVCQKMLKRDKKFNLLALKVVPVPFKR